MDKKILEDIMAKYKLDEKVIKAIFESQFEFIRLNITSKESIEELQNYRLAHLGLLTAKYQTLNKKYIKNREEDENFD